MLTYIKILYQKLSCIVDKIRWKSDVDFATWFDNKALSIDVEDGNMYQPSFNNINKIFNKLEIHSNDKIIDIGCGKGKAMAIMAKYPFESVDGFDLSEKMVCIANNNFSKINLKHCHAFKADANTFSDYREYKFIYMFNAVPLRVLKNVVDNMIESFDIGVPYFFVYLNPVYNKLFLDRGFDIVFTKNNIIKWKRINVYKYIKNQ